MKEFGMSDVSDNNKKRLLLKKNRIDTQKMIAKQLAIEIIKKAHSQACDDEGYVTFRIKVVEYTYTSLKESVKLVNGVVPCEQTLMGDFMKYKVKL
jgi:hypothetical protein